MIQIYYKNLTKNHKLAFHLKFSDKFISLQIGMNGVVIRMLSALIAIWYCVSIIGFDVHTCSGSGRSFVTTFVNGMECQDIHPGYGCNEHACSGHCCSGHEADEYESETEISSSCCTDDVQVLLLTGCRTDEGQNDDRLSFFSGMFLPMVLSNEVPVSQQAFFSYPDISPHDFGRHLPDDIQSVFGIWRI